MENILVSKILKFGCYATAVFTVLVTLTVLIKPVRTVERESSVRAEIQQAIDKAGLNGLIELE